MSETNPSATKQTDRMTRNANLKSRLEQIRSQMKTPENGRPAPGPDQTQAQAPAPDANRKPKKFYAVMVKSPQGKGTIIYKLRPDQLEKLAAIPQVKLVHVKKLPIPPPPPAAPQQLPQDRQLMLSPPVSELDKTFDMRDSLKQPATDPSNFEPEQDTDSEEHQ